MIHPLDISSQYTVSIYPLDSIYLVTHPPILIHHNALAITRPSSPNPLSSPLHNHHFTITTPITTITTPRPPSPQPPPRSPPVHADVPDLGGRPNPPCGDGSPGGGEGRVQSTSIGASRQSTSNPLINPSPTLSPTHPPSYPPSYPPTHPPTLSPTLSPIHSYPLNPTQYHTVSQSRSHHLYTLRLTHPLSSLFFPSPSQPTVSSPYSHFITPPLPSTPPPPSTHPSLRTPSHPSLPTHSPLPPVPLSLHPQLAATIHQLEETHRTIAQLVGDLQASHDHRKAAEAQVRHTPYPCSCPWIVDRWIDRQTDGR